MSAAEFRDVKLGACEVSMTTRPDGSLLVVNKQPLSAYPAKVTDSFVHWATTDPARVWITERGVDGQWVRLCYGEGLARVRRIAAGLLAHGLSAERPLVILSGNSIDHAVMAVGAMYAGIAYAPLAPAYSTVSKDYAKLRYIFDLLTPGLVYADDGQTFGPAFAAVAKEAGFVASRHTPQGAITFEELMTEGHTAAADAAHAKVGLDSIAKFIFTSGSSGPPKAVITTQRMLTSNMAQSGDHFAYLQDEPPVLLDWLPWNHVSGGSHNFNMVITLGGTFHIDAGKPLPGAIETTVANLRDVSPNWYFNVPTGYAALLPYLEGDTALANSFFRDLKLCLYAGAGIDTHVWAGIDAVARRVVGRPILFSTSLGSTETAPGGLFGDFERRGPGVVGLPARGLDLKLVGGPDRWEARVRGPNVTPGYWRSPDLTARLFDEEGFLKMGDALRFVDPDDVTRGFRFDGRFGEDFKLSTGTWVAAGPLRITLMDATAPLLKDAVIVGMDRMYVGALCFLEPTACAAYLGDDIHRPVATLAADPRIRAAIRQRLDGLAAHATGSSTRVDRLLLMDREPDAERGELTDKGSISSAGVVANQSQLIERLFASNPENDVICAPRQPSK